MPKFNVTVTRDCTESTVVDVEAADAGTAAHKAMAEALASPDNFDWVRDEGSEDARSVVATDIDQPSDYLTDDCATCAASTETRVLPCDECGYADRA